MKRSAPPELQPESFRSDPLSDAMWEALDSVMLAIDNDDAFSAAKIDGYIAGVLCCPVRLTTGEWFPAIWGSGQTVESLGDMKMEIVVRLVMQHYNHVKSCLEDPLADYEPKYEVDTDGSTLWEIWAEGFNDAIEFGERGWGKIGRMALRSDIGADTVMTLMGLLDLAGGGELVPETDRVEMREVAPDLIPVLTKAIYELSTRGKIRDSEDVWNEELSPFPKVGRNDPCPCGSGKKYKKCHGA
jgi:uncharacterized protein